MTSLSIFERTTVVIHSVTTLNLYCADYVENKIQFNSIQFNSICRISGVCERAMSVIKLDLISEN